MPTVTIPLRELRARLGEVPYREEDCYLISIRHPESGAEFGWDGTGDGEEGVFPVPFLASRFDPIAYAQEQSSSSWDYAIGGDRARLGNNTPSVRTDVLLVFQWGVGHPDGTLPHVPDEYGFYCKHCRKERNGRMADCLVRRVYALLGALQKDDRELIEIHKSALEKFHPLEPGRFWK